MSEDHKITCPKCGTKMMASQERAQVRCITADCPLPNAAQAGKEYISASESMRGSMRGIIIGNPPPSNVVRPAFGGKKPALAVVAPSSPIESPQSEATDDHGNDAPLTGEALDRARQDLVYMLTHAEFVMSMGAKLTKAGDEIFSLRDFTPDQKNIRLRREGLKTFSLEDICKEVEKTQPLQWRSQPSYLGALTLEHHCRVQAALSVMPREEQRGDEK